MSKAQIELRKQRKVTFYERHGLNIKLSSTHCVASREARVEGVREMTAVDGYGVVFSSEPVAVGCMFKVAVLESDDCFDGGVVSLSRPCTTVYRLYIVNRVYNTI